MLDLVIDIGKYAPYSFLEQVSKELIRTPIVLITESFLLSFAYYVVSILQNISNKKEMLIAQQNEAGEAVDRYEIEKGLTAANYKLYDLTIFWSIMTYTKKDINIDIKLKDYAIKCLLIVADKSEVITKWLMTEIFSSINQGGVRIVKFFVYFYKFMKKKWKVKEFIKANTTDRSAFLPRLLKSFIKYKKEANEKAKDIENPMQFVV